jgi:hypothetical protein
MKVTPTSHPDCRKQSDAMSLLRTHFDSDGNPPFGLNDVTLTSVMETLKSNPAEKAHKWRELQYGTPIWCSSCHGVVLKSDKTLIHVTTCVQCGMHVHKRCRRVLDRHRCGLFDHLRDDYSLQNRQFILETNVSYSLEFPDEEDEENPNSMDKKEKRKSRESESEDEKENENDQMEDCEVTDGLSCRVLLFSDCLLCLSPALLNAAKV